MKQDYQFDNAVDENGNPTGGYVDSIGLQIRWQKGPLGIGEFRVAPNGAFVETVIDAAKTRLEHYQESKFACEENAEAIQYLAEALRCLNERTARREARNVEGTHAV